MSDVCVHEFCLLVRELQYDIIVCTPAFGLVTTSTVCSRCPMVVEGHQFRVNLIYFTSERLEGYLRDGLTICILHSHRLW